MACVEWLLWVAGEGLMASGCGASVWVTKRLELGGGGVAPTPAPPSLSEERQRWDVFQGDMRVSERLSQGPAPLCGPFHTGQESCTGVSEEMLPPQATSTSWLCFWGQFPARARATGSGSHTADRWLCTRPSSRGGSAGASFMGLLDVFPADSPEGPEPQSHSTFSVRALTQRK